MTELNTLDEQIDALLDWLAKMHSTKPKGWNDEMVTSKAKAKLKTLFTEHSKQEVIKFVAMLDEQDPYIPLDGTPRQYVHDKLNEYLELSKRNKGEDNE